MGNHTFEEIIDCDENLDVASDAQESCGIALSFPKWLRRKIKR